MLLAILACASGAPDSADSVATGTPADSRGDDSTRDDTGTRTDSTVDSVVDSALTDTGLDTAATDTGTDTGTTDTGVLGSLVADFALEDLNRGSTRYGEVVSPRDYLTQVSGWYFVHAT